MGGSVAATIPFPVSRVEGLGLAQGALDHAIAYVQQRHAFGQAVGDFLVEGPDASGSGSRGHPAMLHAPGGYFAAEAAGDHSLKRVLGALILIFALIIFASSGTYVVQPGTRGVAVPGRSKNTPTAAPLRGATNSWGGDYLAPPAGTATFYGMFSLEPQPPTVVHVCDDVACLANGAEALCSELAAQVSPSGQPYAGGQAVWKRSPCLGLCERGPAALVQRAKEGAERNGLAHAVEFRQALLRRRQWHPF